LSNAIDSLHTDQAHSISDVVPQLTLEHYQSFPSLLATVPTERQIALLEIFRQLGAYEIEHNREAQISKQQLAEIIGAIIDSNENESVRVEAYAVGSYLNRIER
ncbi:MAG: hypothetical protein KDD42_07465, partial [Bdellovibrionales bacterium]|nr:hypothetical protein [Bdellovibrionales bacterium]